MTDNNKLEIAIADYISGISIQKCAKRHGLKYHILRDRLRKRRLTRRKKCEKIEKSIPAKRTFGKLSVRSVLVNDGGRVVYQCECQCGNKLNLRASKFLVGDIIECGRCRNSGCNNPRWKGCGLLSGTRWHKIKNCAVRKSRHLEFEITQEYAWNLYKSQAGICALSGLPIPFQCKVESKEQPSLDRIDSSKGYIIGNVQWVHKDINTMKWNLVQERFIELCKLVAKVQ